MNDTEIKACKMKTGTELIAEERARQISSENWTASHDDTHKRMEMSQAAAAYTKAAVLLVLDVSSVADISASRPMDWPWALKWWKPSNEPIRNLVKAGALIAAEIDRLQRNQQTKNAGDREPDAAPNAGKIAGSISANGSTDHWRQLAIAAMKVSDYRPHPREWWNDEMKPDREAEYINAMKQVGAMKTVLGL